MMNREEMLERIADAGQKWDFIVIGGGATGVGVALEAASRGYRIVLLEQNDFASGTSSRSTKLIHGGVRYLQQGNVALVLEALKERGILRRNAPHLVHDLPFIVPTYDWWEGPFYGIGLKLYDMLAGKEGFGPSKILSKEETLEKIPTVETDGLRGGVIYHDGQFDDSRLVVNLVQTAAEQGGTLINYFEAEKLIKKNGLVGGVIAREASSATESAGWMTLGCCRSCGPVRGFTLSWTDLFCRGKPPSWCPTPTTAGCSSRFPGTTGFLWVPPTRRWRMCPWSLCPWTMK